MARETKEEKEIRRAGYVKMVLQREEGLRLESYKDTKGVWTLGYGHNLESMGLRGELGQLECTQALADRWLSGDIAEAAGHAVRYALNAWEKLSMIRQVVLICMAYQLGPRGLGGFKRLQLALKWGFWDYVAPREMLDSKWAREDSPARAARMAELWKDNP